MIDEGRRRAAAAGVDNLTFVHGGSDDLERVSSVLGDFAAVVISQAFHWMADQDAVICTLDSFLDRERGAVALLGYVNDRTTTESSWDSIVLLGTLSSES
jgi:ubiquinone/menaquinone biosynthesis C-methylase UbiE